MYYVYLIRSLNKPSQKYVGFSSNLKQRLIDHNRGKCAFTANYMPWQLITYIAFSNKLQALTFERYLKKHSGRAFAEKRLWEPTPKT